MKKRITLFYATLLFVLGMNAQSTLNIKVLSGEDSSFPTADIKKISFLNRNVVIEKIDNESINFSVVNIKRFDFFDIATDLNLIEIDQVNKKTLLYPNPVRDELYIKCKQDNDCELKIEIVDLNGKILRSAIIDTKSSINVSALNQGMYICRILMNNNIENIKFSKQ